MTIKKTHNLILFLFVALIFVVVVLGPRKLWSNAQQLYNKWMILTMILEKIERFYVDDKNPDELLKDAIDGMLFGLDPHSVYLSPKEYKDYSKRYEGYLGVGLKYTRLDSQVVVTSVVKNSPAQNAGIRVGDRIAKIAGTRIASIDNKSLERLLGGPQDKIVTVVIERPDATRQTLDLVKRQIIDSTIPVYFKIKEDVGYIKLSYFAERTPNELDDALSHLKANGMRQLVLDLRDNTGGTFDAAVAVADRFIAAGKMIVFTKGRAPQTSQQFIAAMSGDVQTPMIVLVNEATASDAEIVSGALQDWDRALIVGRRTFGKALVQTEYPFQDESVLLLTTARYYTPLGRLIQKQYSENELAPADSKPQKATSYKTPKGRIVYGGGGIQPDIALKKNELNFPKNLRPLYSGNENIFFKFADKYVILHKDEYPTELEFFIRNFSIDENLWQAFKTFSHEINIGVSLSDIEENKIFLKNEIKTEIAGRLWGDHGRLAATTINDPEVNAGLVYLNQAEALLNQ